MNIKTQLQTGIEVEKEHTGDVMLATKIASDHLRLDKNYYTKLLAAGLVDETPAIVNAANDRALTGVPNHTVIQPKKSNTAPTKVTQALAPKPKTAISASPHFIDAETKTKPLGDGDATDHFLSKMDAALDVAGGIVAAVSSYINGDALGMMTGMCEGGSSLVNPRAGITSDQKGKRWSIDAYPSSEKKLTPKLSEATYGRLCEMPYPGNLGMMEIAKFYNTAPDWAHDEVDRFIKLKQYKDAWLLIQVAVGTKLVGYESDFGTKAEYDAVKAEYDAKVGKPSEEPEDEFYNEKGQVDPSGSFDAGNHITRHPADR